MPALTLTQPWASLVAIGAKRIETRSWNTTYRGPIAIHAAKGWPNEAKELVWREPFLACLREAGLVTFNNFIGVAGAGEARLPVGAVIATAQLDDTFPITEESWSYLLKFGAQHEADFGDYSYPGRFGWVLTDVSPLEEPVAAKGALGLWRWAGVSAAA